MECRQFSLSLQWFERWFSIQQDPGKSKGGMGPKKAPLAASRTKHVPSFAKPQAAH
jgi:hypothetical protein